MCAQHWLMRLLVGLGRTRQINARRHTALSISLQSLAPCRLALERRRVGFAAPLSVALVSRGPILQGLTPYARRAFLPLLEVGISALV